MYVYDIEEEGTLSDDWAISFTNITITGLEPTYPFLDVTCPVPTCPISMVTITTETCNCLTSNHYIVHLILLLYVYIYYIDDTQVDKCFATAVGVVGGNDH